MVEISIKKQEEQYYAKLASLEKLARDEEILSFRLPSSPVPYATVSSRDEAGHVVDLDENKHLQ